MNFPRGPLPGDTFPFPQRRDPEGPPIAAPRTARGRRVGPPVDTGTVALAMTGLTFYWTMPMMMRRRRRPRSN